MIGRDIMNILVAEDEKDIRNLLKINLTEAGYTVYAAADGIEALVVMKNNQIHLAILDVMMPRLDGFNLLRKIRETSTIPVLLLTARSEDMDKVLGFGLGADDYLVKPFSMAELTARVAAQLRRSHEYGAVKSEHIAKLSFGNWELDKDACCIYKAGQLVELNAKEYKLLSYLMENPAHVFTKRQLYRAVWEESDYYDYDDNTIMVHISHLRSKLEEDPKNPKFIKTIRGIGYKFHPDKEVKCERITTFTPPDLYARESEQMGVNHES
jgi:DNA-binding response OmpR family regulator